MVEELDLSVDPLAEAPLTSEQRRAWNAVRGELASARARNQELVERLHQYEQQEDVEAVILNRADFNREVARMLAFDERYGGISSILYFDFEGIPLASASAFEQTLNSMVLKEISSALTRSVRKSDIVGRIAPDEYGVLLVRCDNENAWKKAEILSNVVQEALAKIQDSNLDIQVSYGAYTFRDNEDLAVGLKEAAESMTRAKAEPSSNG